MDPIRDDELVLYHGRDGLGAARLREIEDALFADPELRARYATLRDAIDDAAAALAIAPADAGLEQRLWARVAQALPAEPWSAKLRRLLSPRGPVLRAGFALSIAVALVFAYRLGRQDAPALAPEQARLLAEDAARRVLADHLAGHLEATERALLVASNQPEAAATAQALAQQLVTSHRLYAAAVDRAGRPELAAFLRELEPVLLRLAHESDTTAVADRIRERDLAFKTRAAAALVRHELEPGGTAL